MATHTARLLFRRPVAESTMAFHFEKPTAFDFRPGQAIDLALMEKGSASRSQDSRHTFSIVSAPFQEELVVATRMRDSAFKRALGALSLGSVAVVNGPFGLLTLHKKLVRAAVLIAGGIGVTPFMSMLRQAAHDQLPQDLRLLYSNRRPEDAPFLAELQQHARSNPRFQLLATMTDMARSAQLWNGHAQRIDSNLVGLVAKDLSNPVFYISGPPRLVEAVRQTLADAGVDEDDVRSEEFYGY